VYARDLTFVLQGGQEKRMLGPYVRPCVADPDTPLVVLLPGEEIDMDVWFTVMDPFALKSTDTWTGVVQQCNVLLRHVMEFPSQEELDAKLPSSTAIEIYQTCEIRDRDDDEPNCFDMEDLGQGSYRLVASRPWACSECRGCHPLLERHGLKRPNRRKEVEDDATGSELPDWIVAVDTRSAQNAHELFRKGVQRMIHIGYEA
jgi:hypothetical protein